MFKSIRRAFRALTPKMMAEVELQEARKALLIAETGKDWAESQVRYNKARIARLEQQVKALS